MAERPFRMVSVELACLSPKLHLQLLGDYHETIAALYLGERQRKEKGSHYRYGHK